MKMGAPKWPPNPQRSERSGTPVALLGTATRRPRSWIHRGRGEAGALVPPEHHVEVLDAVGGAPLAEVVDRGQADGSTCPVIGHHGDVTVIGPDHAAGRRSFTFTVDTDEGLAGIEISIDRQ